MLLERLLPQAEIVWALLPIRLLPGSPAPRGWRRFPQFRRIRRDIEVAVVAGRGVRVAAVSEFAVVGVDLRLPQHYRNRLEKFDLIRGFATQSTSKGTRTKFRFCERGGGAA